VVITKPLREALREAGFEGRQASGEDLGGVRGRHVIAHVRGLSMYLGKKAQHGKINKRDLFAVFAPKVIIRFDF